MSSVFYFSARIAILGRNVQKRFFQIYGDYYFSKNPFDPINMRSFAGTSVSMEQIVPFDEFQRSEYYIDSIRTKRSNARRQSISA